jgi:hypothetical protein
MFAMLFQTQIFLLAEIVALTLSIEKMFRNNFYAIAGVVTGNKFNGSCCMVCATIVGHKTPQWHGCGGTPGRARGPTQTISLFLEIR